MLRYLCTILSDDERLECFLDVIFDNLVESNVFLRALILTLEREGLPLAKAESEVQAEVSQTTAQPLPTHPSIHPQTLQSTHPPIHPLPHQAERVEGIVRQKSQENLAEVPNLPRVLSWSAVAVADVSSHDPKDYTAEQNAAHKKKRNQRHG